MDESQDSKPHVTVHNDAIPAKARGESLSIWFFCGILTLGYGIVLVVQGLIEYNHPPANERALPFLQALHPTLWWGLAMFLFGAFYSIKFRPGKA
jgi:hypothetical protein